MQRAYVTATVSVVSLLRFLVVLGACSGLAGLAAADGHHPPTTADHVSGHHTDTNTDTNTDADADTGRPSAAAGTRHSDLEASLPSLLTTGSANPLGGAPLVAVEPSSPWWHLRLAVRGPLVGVGLAGGWGPGTSPSARRWRVRARPARAGPRRS